MKGLKRLSAILGVVLAALLLLGAGTSAESVVESSPRIVILPEAIRPGDPLTVAIVFPGKTDAEELSRTRSVLVAPDGRRLAAASAFPIGTTEEGEAVYCALLAVPSTSPVGPMRIVLENAGKPVAEEGIILHGRDFLREEIDLNKNNTELRTIEDPQKASESAALWRLLSSFNPAAFSLGAFRPPVESTRRTSHFGDRRKYLYSDGSSDSSIHAGIDYGVPRGTPVRSSAAGRVVLSRSRIVTGNSVVIEHLPGVFTLYYHLDKLDVKEGETVEAGRVIGTSGSTGLSTGPHLHWEVRVAGEAADPDSFVARAVLDKDLVLSKIGGHHDR